MENQFKRVLDRVCKYGLVLSIINIVLIFIIAVVEVLVFNNGENDAPSWVVLWLNISCAALIISIIVGVSINLKSIKNCIKSLLK